MEASNRLYFSICLNLPSLFGINGDTTKCRTVLIIVSMSGGSLVTSSLISGGAATSASEANAAVSASFSQSAKMDGFSIASATSSSSGYDNTSSTSSSGTNLGLILGLSIPLLLLCNYPTIQ